MYLYFEKKSACTCCVQLNFIVFLPHHREYITHFACLVCVALNHETTLSTLFSTHAAHSEGVASAATDSFLQSVFHVQKFRLFI